MSDLGLCDCGCHRVENGKIFVYGYQVCGCLEDGDHFVDGDGCYDIGYLLDSVGNWSHVGAHDLVYHFEERYLRRAEEIEKEKMVRIYTLGFLG